MALDQKEFTTTICSKYEHNFYSCYYHHHRHGYYHTNHHKKGHHCITSTIIITRTRPSLSPESHHNYYQNHTITIAKITSSLPLEPPPLLYYQNHTITITRTTSIIITRTTQPLLSEPHHHYYQNHTITITSSGVTSTISEGDVFIYSCFAQLIFLMSI